jgi:hypothetical protein
MGKEIDLIKRRYLEIAKKIQAHPKNIFFYETKQDCGYPHIEFKNSCYYYIVTEKGIELQRKSTSDADEILYWLVLDLTKAEAQDYELKNRDSSEDFRRKYFWKFLELLNKINPQWAEIQKSYCNKVLITNPFMDDKQPRDIK